MTLGGYKQRCAECDDSYSRAASFCPYCGTPSGVEFELGIGAVLYEDRPDTPDDERRLHHVTDRRVSLEDGDVYYVIWDGTHTRRYHYHAEDVLADFTPAGWQWPTGRKPTYWLTRHCDVDDEMDLMTDGGSDQSTGGTYQSESPTHGGYGMPRGAIPTIPENAPTVAIGFCPMCGENARGTCANRGMFDCPRCTFWWFDDRVGSQTRTFEDYFSPVEDENSRNNDTDTDRSGGGSR